MVANGVFGLTKSGLFTFLVGIVFGCAFTYLFAFSSNFSASYTIPNAPLAYENLPRNPTDHSFMKQASGPVSDFVWNDDLSHSHKGRSNFQRQCAAMLVCSSIL